MALPAFWQPALCLTLTVLMSTKVDVNATPLAATFEGVVRYVAIAGRKSLLPY